MIRPKKVIDEITSKWQTAASLKRKKSRRSSSSTYEGSSSNEQQCRVQVAQKGHFVVYSTDNKRFVVPLHYLNHNIFKELLRMSEEEFGLPCTGPIILPCDAVLLDFVISLVRQRVSDEPLIISMVAHRCSSYTPITQNIPLPSF